MEVGQHRFEAPPAEVLRLLEQAAVEDDAAEKARAAAAHRGCGGCWMLFLAVALVGGATTVFGPIGLASLVVAAPLGLFAVRVMNRSDREEKQAAQHDLDDEKLDLVRRVLRTMAVDLPPDRPLLVEVDFTEALLKLSSRDGEARQAWLAMQGRLADRSAWSLGLERSIKRKSRSKSKGRVKVKERKRDTLTLQVRVPGRDFAGVPARLGPPPASLAVARCEAVGDTVRVALASPTALVVRYRGESGSNLDKLIGPEAVLSALVWLFRALR